MTGRGNILAVGAITDGVGRQMRDWRGEWDKDIQEKATQESGGGRGYRTREIRYGSWRKGSKIETRNKMLNDKWEHMKMLYLKKKIIIIENESAVKQLLT